MDVAAERRDVREQGAQRVHHALGEPAAKQRRDERRRARALRQSRAESLGKHTQAHERLVGAAAAAAAEGRAASRRRLECVTALCKKRLQEGGDRAAEDEGEAAEADEGGGAELGRRRLAERRQQVGGHGRERGGLEGGGSGGGDAGQQAEECEADEAVAVVAVRPRALIHLAQLAVGERALAAAEEEAAGASGAAGGARLGRLAHPRV